MKRYLSLALVATAWVAVQAGMAVAAEGDLDPSFASSGVVTTDFSCRNDYATSVAVQPDGKIVAAGRAEVASLVGDFSLVRYNPDGTLDPTFGTGGIALTGLAVGADVAIQADGKIVVVGGDGDEVVLLRLERDGTPDPSFAGGVATAGFGGSYRPSEVALQSDGKIVVVGSYYGDHPEFLVLRFLTDGTLDAAFGRGGLVTTSWAGAGGEASAVAVQHDGKIVVVGSQTPSLVGCSPLDPCDSAFAVARYNSDGSLDLSFGAGGKVTTGRPGETNTANGVVIQADGRIVVAGGRDTRPVAYSDFVVVRYDPDGTLDPSFGVNGEVVTDFGGEDAARAVTLQVDGRIVAAGMGGTSDPVLDPDHGWIVPAEFAIARYQPDGNPDYSFGAGGQVLVDVGGGGAHALALDGRGRIIAAGVGSWGCGRDFTLVRLTGPPALPVGLVDTSQGRWHLQGSSSIATTFFYGDPGDFPLMGDWDCNGTDTPGMYRQSDGFVYLRNANSQGVADIRFLLGNPGDIPLAGDFNGDGCDTVSIYRPDEQRFYVANSLGADNAGIVADSSFLFGDPGDKPLAGDWDSDGISEFGLHREATGAFYWRNTLDTGIATGEMFFGNQADRLVSGDWGVVDGIDTPAAFRPSNLTFYVRHTLTQGNADSSFVWTGAASGWLPVSGAFGLG